MKRIQEPFEGRHRRQGWVDGFGCRRVEGGGQTTKVGGRVRKEWKKPSGAAQAVEPDLEVLDGRDLDERAADDDHEARCVVADDGMRGTCQSMSVGAGGRAGRSHGDGVR